MSRELPPRSSRTTFARPSAEAPAKVRFRGLVYMAAGVVLTPVFFGAAYFLGLALQSLIGGKKIPIAAALVAIPIIVSFKGWLELLTGISFTRLADRFDNAGFFAKTGLTVLVLASIALYIAMFYGLYVLANSRGWL